MTEDGQVAPWDDIYRGVAEGFSGTGGGWVFEICAIPGLSMSCQEDGGASAPHWLESQF
ncbi:hypothetical protein LRS71_00270 [Rhodococcus pyridinivorans]|uniref:hypothetical protein n=1 Tax=Rhodococcus pyridinivorans TaxID=103816 RepID=UPI001E3A35BD|nr:hypothetical protein [Rhodococcus pyridinivorans]MCD5418021.1 hypothetical protein [Rhodococcus pyridinivorans]